MVYLYIKHKIHIHTRERKRLVFIFLTSKKNFFCTEILSFCGMKILLLTQNIASFFYEINETFFSRYFLLLLDKLKLSCDFEIFSPNRYRYYFGVCGNSRVVCYIFWIKSICNILGCLLTFSTFIWFSSFRCF